MVGDEKPNVRLEQVYGQAQAFAVINAAIQDYREAFGIV
jgi:hypothetical protein